MHNQNCAAVTVYMIESSGKLDTRGFDMTKAAAKRKAAEYNRQARNEGSPARYKVVVRVARAMIPTY